MSYISLVNVKKEFLNFLRNADILSTTERGVTTTTDSFTASGGEEEFTLTNSIVRNVRSITVNGTAISFGKDYTLNYTNNNITSITIYTLSASDSIVVTYDYKATSGSSIYPDYPRQDLKLSSYPRVGFDIIDYDKETGAMGNVNISNIAILVKILSSGTLTNDEYLDNLNQAVIDNQTNFYYLSYIKPIRIEPNIPVSERANNKIFQVSMRIMARNNYEIN
jgi:hypothetical protein